MPNRTDLERVVPPGTPLPRNIPGSAGAAGPAGVVTGDGAQVATDQATSSATYADLGTAGPSVTLTTGAEVLVWGTCSVYRASGTGNSGFVSVEVSGASSVAAADANGNQWSAVTAGYTFSMAFCVKFSGLTPGSNTFKMKYRCDGGTFNFLNRNLVVLPIG